MKIVSPLFSRLIGKRCYFLAFICEIFPQLAEIYFDGLLRGETLYENNIQIRRDKL